VSKCLVDSADLLALVWRIFRFVSRDDFCFVEVAVRAVRSVDLFPFKWLAWYLCRCWFMVVGSR